MWRSDEAIELGCELTDIGCLFIEGQARSLAQFVTWFAEITIGSQKVAPGTALWDTAIGEVGYWMPFAILTMIAIAAISLARSPLQMSWDRLLWTISMSFLAVPSTLFALTFGGELLRLSDVISDGLIARLGGNEGFVNLIRAVIQGGYGDSAAGQIASMAGNTSVAVVVLLLLLLVGLFLMACAIAVRDFLIMCLIAFSPLAFMAITDPAGKRLVQGWAFAGLALVLSKPLMFGVLAMVLKGMNGITLLSPQTLTLGFGFIMVAFMPMMAFTAFNWLGAGAASQAGDNLGSAAGGMAKSTSFNITNLGSKVAGFAGGWSARSLGRGGSQSAAKPSSAPSSTKGAGNTGMSSQQAAVTSPEPTRSSSPRVPPNRPKW